MLDFFGWNYLIKVEEYKTCRTWVSTNPTMHLAHIPQYTTLEHTYAHFCSKVVYVWNGKVTCGICDIGLSLYTCINQPKLPGQHGICFSNDFSIEIQFNKYFISLSSKYWPTDRYIFVQNTAAVLSWHVQNLKKWNNSKTQFPSDLYWDAKGHCEWAPGARPTDEILIELWFH